MKSMAIFLSNVSNDFGKIYSNLAAREDLKVANLEIITVNDCDNQTLLEQIFAARHIDRWTVSNLVRSMETIEEKQVMFVEIEWNNDDYFANKYEGYVLRKRANSLMIDLIPVCGTSQNIYKLNNVCIISENDREFQIFSKAEEIITHQRRCA